jgi:ribose 5-phosphate isomerase A
MTIYERALELVSAGATVGLGSGRAAWAFVRLLGEDGYAIKKGIRGVAASEETAKVARAAGVPLVELADARELELTVDGADEVDPDCNLIKGYGRALLREKVLASVSKRLVILVGEDKLVPQLGTRGKLPVEVVPFARPACERRLKMLNLNPALWEVDGKPGTTDNGNCVLDCSVEPIRDPNALETSIRAIPGVVGTGLFLGMADTVLVGDGHFEFVKEMTRA